MSYTSYTKCMHCGDARMNFDDTVVNRMDVCPPCRVRISAEKLKEVDRSSQNPYANIGMDESTGRNITMSHEEKTLEDRVESLERQVRHLMALKK